MLGHWSTLDAVLFCISCSIIYVGSLYIIVPKKVRLYPRDHHLQIQYRSMAVSVATIFCMFVYVLVLPTQKYLHVNAWQSLGFYNPYSTLVSETLTNTSKRSAANEYLTSILTTILLMLIFYLGPVITSIHYAVICCYYHVNYDGSTKLISDNEKRDQSYYHIVVRFLKNIYFVNRDQFMNQSLWMIARALLIAPITEEVMFRSLMIPTLYMAFISSTSINNSNNNNSYHNIIDTTNITSTTYTYYTPWVIVWMNPLFFGCAHIHHFYEKLLSGIEVKNAILSTMIQFIYTSIFGFIATLLFMRTGNICCAIVSHMICNYIGLPDIGFLFAANVDRNSSNSYACMYQWRYVHFGLHILGLVLFTWAILPLTEQYAVTSIYWKSYLKFLSL